MADEEYEKKYVRKNIHFFNNFYEISFMKNGKAPIISAVKEDAY